ncbi:MAG: hypothetical protein C0502_05120 [Opitutus sp.]|nr:hypothetical protein [Opitutus sp.]
MTRVPPTPQEQAVRRTNWVLIAVSVVFLALAAAMLANVWGHPPPQQDIPLVDPAFLDQTASRQSYADLVRAKEDLSDFKCYTCHEKGEPPPLRFDDQHNIIVPEEHANIETQHGSHNRNNLCFNCHNENNLLSLSTREKHELSFADSSRLCGSCHGPTFRDWEAGVHGRKNGYWDKSRGESRRLDCVNCHNPHAPRIPARPPAPGPHPLRTPEPSGRAASAPTH